MHIMLVDDHSLIRSGISDSLAKHYPGIKISEAESSKAALSLAREQCIDLALVDLFMPGEKLFSLVRELGSRDMDIPFIVLSSSDNPSHIRKCIDLGALGYVPKSSAQSELFAAVDRVLAGGTYYPSPALQEHQPAPVADEEPVSMSYGYSEVENMLTARQMEILELIAHGQTNKQIANNLGVSNYTVKVHVSAVFKALGLSNRSQAAILGEKIGLSSQVTGN